MRDSDGPSWLTFLGHMKDSLWSMDLFRCEAATLRTHWVLVVMDQYTRRIIGFGVHAGTVDGAWRIASSQTTGVGNMLHSFSLYLIHFKGALSFGEGQRGLRILQLASYCR